MGIQNELERAPDLSRFAHRLNSNGTLDSTCRTCFARVAAEVSADRLEQHESAHVCSPYLANRFRSVKRES